MWILTRRRWASPCASGAKPVLSPSGNGSLPILTASQALASARAEDEARIVRAGSGFA
jgi:hypothetical protein